ncbi:hypothetical protein WK80_22195 [Burkholderia multivorans]|uniref:hypothetical protein n=1 Tax=Burkholderia multivorans TaxID=87883 RepID=UPI0007541251|nr:hypothetical protein [Burkholderia multivorans]KVV22303.1 hypothetical protein WK80_22195 [Burkholderia multivorans]MCA8385372.1 phage tail protein [Burkholderia multivorans]
MINVYEIGTTLKIVDMVTPHLLKMSEQFAKVDALALQVNKRLQKISSEATGIKNLAAASKSLGTNLKTIKDEALLAERNLRLVHGALPAGGIGLEAELIAANAQARTLAATLAGIRGGRWMPPLPSGGGSGSGGGAAAHGGGRRGGHIHGGNLHFGTHGIGIGGVGVGLMSDALVPLGAAMVAGYVGKQFYEGAKDYQNAFMRFKTLNLGDQVNDEAEKFVRATRVFGVSQTELMKAMAESVGLFSSFEEAQKYTPMLLTLGKANAAIFGDKLGKLDDEGLKNLLKFIDRRGGFKNEETFQRNLDLAERLITGSGGFLKFNDLGQFSQHAGVAFRGLSDEGLLHMSGLMIEQGGSKAATSLMSLYQNLIAGRVPKKTMGFIQDLGLAQLVMETHGAVGGKPLKSLVMKNVKDSSLLQADPAKWMTDVLMPALAKKGITKDADVLKAVNDVLSNRNASNQASIMTTQQFQVLRDYKLAKGAMTAKDVIKMYEPSASGAEADFEAAWADFKKQFGATMLPQVTNMLKVGADMLRAIADAANSPAFKAISGFGEGAVHAFAWPYRLLFGSGEKNGDSHASTSVASASGANSGMVHTTINLDGRKIASAISPFMADHLARSSSTSTLDTGLHLPMPGMN